LIFSAFGVKCGGVAQEVSGTTLAQAPVEQAPLAQTSSAQITAAQSANDALQEMTRLAGVIFTGQVVGVRRLVGVNGATGVVEITFAVEDAVRGVSGRTYTVREWAGLWPAGDTPFCVGQRYLMLLHAPSASGLSSPVGGMDGAIPIRGGLAASTETASAGTVVGNSAPVDGRVVDLRWVGTRVVQPLAYRTKTEADVRARIDSGTVVSAASNSASQTAAYTTVVGMLRGWEKANHAAQ
jgi:hypothetical protein